MLGVLLGLLFQAPAPAPELALHEAVFRYLFTHNQSGLQQKAKSYHLCFGPQGEKQKDPTSALLARFQNHRPPVKSCSTFNPKPHNALAFHIARVDWTDSTHAEVTAGYYEANLSSAESLFLVERKNGEWQVTGAALQTIARRSPSQRP
jgi:hypothetical protein